jgi:hypothetical protein
MEQRWDYNDRRKLKDSEKKLTQCRFVHHKSTWTDLGANRDLWGKKPVTSRLSYGTAQ